MHRIRLIVFVVITLGIIGLSTGCGQHPGQKVSRLTLFVTGHIQGYIKNCGCSSGQYGGLMRVARLTREEQESALKPQQSDRGLPPVSMLIDIGNFTDPSTDVTRINSEGVVAGLMSLDYDMVGLGLYELSYMQQDLWALLKDSGLALTAANLEFSVPAKGEDFSSDLNSLIKPYQIVDLGNDFKAGVIHVIDDNVDEVIGKQNGFNISEAETAARAILNAHGDEADYWIMTIADTRQLGTGPQTLADLPLVMEVIGFRQSNPTESFDSTAVKFPYFVDAPYRKARDVVRATTYFKPTDEPPVISVVRFAVPETISADKQISTIIDELAPRLEKLENELAEVALNAENHPFYIGHEACRKCHEDILDQQLTTHHATALESLQKKGQDRSAACVPCHVVGHISLPDVEWSGGWNLIQDQPLMRGVHCENCHGPGEYHAIAMFSESLGEPVPEDIAAVLTEDGRTETGMQLADENNCLICHDELNSPDFDFETYWEEIKHGEEEESAGQ